MPKYKYQFKIDNIHMQEKNFSNAEMKKWLKDKELMSSIQNLVGIQISILLEDPKEFPNQGYFFAKSQAEEKASEIVADTIGVFYGGSQEHMPNYVKDVDLHGRYVHCKLVSIDQIQ